MRKLLKLISEKIKKYYNISSIQNIISSTFTVVAISGMIVVALALYIRYSKATEDIIAKNNKAVLEQVNLNLDSYLRKMMKISDTIYYRGIKKKDLLEENINLEMDLLYEENKEHLISISLFSEYGDIISSYPVEKLKENINAENNEWFKIALQKKENLHFSTPHVQNLFYDPEYKYKWVVSLSRAVETTINSKSSSGVLLVDMNFSGIEQISKNVNMGKDGYVYLIDRDGEIIYHPRQQAIYSNLEEETNFTLAKLEDGSHSEVFKGEKRLITIKTVGYTGWKIISVSPMTEMMSYHEEFRIFLVFILLFSALTMLSINMYVSSRIANPIMELERAVKEFEEGVSSLNISEKGSSEVQHLTKAINYMIKEMNKLMENVRIEQEEKRKSELNSLQAQINPHFLYNTLDSIVWMIENENYEGSITMVTSLARFFRISLSKGKNIITVKDELEHAKNYLTIQNIRYKNKFAYKIEADESTLNLSCIKLIVQPIIENAIYHGMEYMDGDGEILIKSYIENNELYIDIIDNGLGMEEEVAQGLLKGSVNSSKKGSGTGVLNVHERIKLYFGKEYGLEIYSEPDEGTRIRIHIPIIGYKG